MDLTNLGEPPSKIAKVEEWIDKVHNVHFSIEERWQEAIKDINCEFTDHQCYCELDWIATDDKPNKPPNMWCENATYWKTQYIPLKDSMSRLLTGNGGALINNLTQQFGYQKARLIFFSMDYKL